MMTLTECIRDHWHSVERDLLAMGFRADDIGTERLSLWELISIVVAAPVNTAVREARDGGWTPTDQLLANISEQRAGVLNLTGRYPRPGVSASEVHMRSANSDGFRPINGVAFQPMEQEEFVRKRAEYMRRNQLAAKRNPELARQRMSRNTIQKQGQL